MPYTKWIEGSNPSYPDMEIKIEVKDFSKLMTGFVDIEKACAIALRNTLNVQAALTRKNSFLELRQDFIIRNDFSEKNILYDRAKGTDIPTMQSSTGATLQADYLKLQHEGGTRKPKAMFKNLAIPQIDARGGSKRKLVSRSFYMEKISGNVVRGRFKKNIKSKRAQAVARAYVAKKNNLFVKYDKNIFAVTSFSKLKKRVKFKMKHLYNVGEKSTKIKGKPWLKTAAQKPAADGQAIFNSQVNKLLKQKKII